MADVSQQSYQSRVRYYFVYARKMSVLCSDSYMVLLQVELSMNQNAEANMIGRL